MLGVCLCRGPCNGDIIGGNCWVYLLYRRCQLCCAGAPHKLPAPSVYSLCQLCGVLSVVTAAPFHPIQVWPGDSTQDRADVGLEGLRLCGGAQTAKQGLSIPMGEPPCAAPLRQLAGQMPALQSCQLSWGAYPSPAVPSGASTFVPSWCRGRQSLQLSAECSSKHQSPSVLPAKFHRPALLVPRSPIACPAPSGSFTVGRQESDVHPH